MNTRQKLEMLIDECGGKKAFCQHVGISQDMLFKVLNGQRNFGRGTATLIDETFPRRISKYELIWMNTKAA